MNSVALPTAAELDAPDRKRETPAEPEAAPRKRESAAEAVVAGDAPKARDKERPPKPAATAVKAPASLGKKDRSFSIVMVGTTFSILVAFAIGRSGLFTAGDDIGYYLGLVGGVVMLLLLLYPLRKHLAALRNWGAVRHWFAVHMVMGIAGPVLVLAHSTFHMHSTNAAVALICMLVVAGSGIVGRFFYTKVHRGLYGEKLNLKDLQSEVGVESADIRSRLHFAPLVEKRLMEFQVHAVRATSGIASDAARFATIATRRYATHRACVRELRAQLQLAAEVRSWDRDKYRRRLKAATYLVDEYLGAAQRVAEFSVYDRLLQLWHVAHVPLVYLLVISGIAHVVAVHMY